MRRISRTISPARPIPQRSSRRSSFSRERLRSWAEASSRSSRSVGVIHALTGGGPGKATETLIYKVYVDGVINLDLGGSSAQSVIGPVAVIVVVQAAGGGTGTLAVQLAKRAGGRVIALASSEEKRELATRLGADATVDSRAEDLKAAILEANEGREVDAVLEMSGGATFEACLRTLAPFGRLVLFGIASREPNEVNTGHLLRHSRAVIGFWLMHLVPRRDEVAAMIADLLGAVASGELEVVVGDVYPLSDARRADEELAGRRTSGKLLLDPSL